MKMRIGLGILKRGGAGTDSLLLSFIQIITYMCSMITAKLLSDNPLFVLINSYTTGLQPTVMANILNTTIKNGKVEAYEVGLPTEEKGIILPCGCSAIKTFDK